MSLGRFEMQSLRWVGIAGIMLAAAGQRLALGEELEAPSTRDKLIVSTLLKLENVNLDEKPAAKQSLLRVANAAKGSEEFLQLVERFSLVELSGGLVEMALADPSGNNGVGAARILVKLNQQPLLAQQLAGPDEPAVKLLTALRLAGAAPLNDRLAALATAGERSTVVRSAAVAALGATGPGEKLLLTLVEEGKLAADLNFAAANVLLSSANEATKAAASKHLKLPATADNKPLPPLAELIRSAGEAERGKQVFATVGQCAKCHKVRGEGKEVGPELSEIGSKLSKEALFTSILDPSAGINFNFETYLLLLEDGTVLSGILVSQTDAEVQLKNAEAIIRKIPKVEISEMKKSPVSLMPADLQKNLTAQNLVDVVEYLSTLKKQ